MAPFHAVRTPLALCLAACVSSCSGSLGSLEAMPASTLSQPVTEPTVVDELVMGTVVDDRLLASKPPPSVPTTTTTTLAPTTSLTAQPPTAPPTTTAAPSPAPSPAPPGDPLEIYRGYLGTLNPSDVVAPVPAFRPQATPGILPYLGLPGVAAREQPVLVKVDNSRRAAPQVGLNSADIVIEEEVEWGITRFAAIFHSTESTVGPVRSGRTTDLNILPAIGSPVFVYSGANTVTDLLLRRLTAVDNRSAERNGNYWRQAGRRAPSNLFSATSSFASSNSSAPPLLHYRDPDQPVSGTPTTTLSIGFGSTSAHWDWSGSMWIRSQNGGAHLTASGEQVNAASVVVLWATSVDTGMVDSAGGMVPELVLLGSGPASVLVDGQRLVGQWQRASLDAPITIIDAAGAPIGVTPGRTWIEFVTSAESVSYS